MRDRGFTVLADWQRTTAPVETVETLRRRCAAAAALTLPSADFTAEDRADCGAVVLERALRVILAAVPRCYCGAPADWRAPIMDDHGTHRPVPRCYPHRGEMARPMIRRRDTVPEAVSPTFQSLRRDALDWREATIRHRAAQRKIRDQQGRAAQLHAGATAQDDPTVSDPTLGTPHGARIRALDLLHRIGEWTPAAPGQRAVPPGAAVWATAYLAARGADGVESAEVAAELEMPDARTLAKYVRRAAHVLTSGHEGAPVPLLWNRTARPPRGKNGHDEPATRIGAHAPRRQAAQRLCADVVSPGNRGAVALPTRDRIEPGDTLPNLMPARRDADGSWRLAVRPAPAPVPTGGMRAADLSVLTDGAPLDRTAPQWASEMTDGIAARPATAQRLAAAAAARSLAPADLPTVSLWHIGAGAPGTGYAHREYAPDVAPAARIVNRAVSEDAAPWGGYVRRFKDHSTGRPVERITLHGPPRDVLAFIARMESEAGIRGERAPLALTPRPRPFTPAPVLTRMPAVVRFTLARARWRQANGVRRPAPLAPRPPRPCGCDSCMDKRAALLRKKKRTPDARG